MRTRSLLCFTSCLLPIIAWQSVAQAESLVVTKTSVYLKDSDEGKAVYEIDAMQLSLPLDKQTLLLGVRVINDLLVAEVINRDTNATDVREWQIPASVVGEIENPIAGDLQFRLEDSWRVMSASQSALLIPPAKYARRIYQVPNNVSISALSPIAREHRILLYTSRPGVDNSDIQILDTKSREIVQSFPLRTLSFGEALFWVNGRFAVGALNSRAGTGISLIDLDKKAVVAEEHFKPGTRAAIHDASVFAIDAASKTSHPAFGAVLR